MALLALYWPLVVAIALETIGTSALTASQQFTRLVPSIITIVAYFASFYFLSLALKTIPVGVAYAIWSGLGIIFISRIGLAVFGQRLDLPALIGIGLIIMGVIVINVFSKSIGH